MKNNGATERPRVLFVSHETTLSGAPIQLVHVAGWLQERGWNILVATPDHGPISEMLTARGVPTVVEPTLLTDLTHEWLRECCREFDVVVAKTIARLDAASRGRSGFNMAGRVLDEMFYTELRSAVAEFPEVELIDALDHSDALRLLNETDVLVLPSRDETMPIAILEATGLGKAVISADVGGVREWLRDGMNGMLVEKENPEALAEALANCATDRELVDRLQAAGARTFERHFTLDRFAVRFAELLVSLHRQPRMPSHEYSEWIA